jgi:predicted metal-binding protein
MPKPRFTREQRRLYDIKKKERIQYPMPHNAVSKMNVGEERALESSLKAVARKWGVDIYPLDVRTINPLQSIRLKCQVPLCEYYDVCKVCPPHIPSVAEFTEALESYSKAFLVVLREKIKNIDEYRKDFTAELKLAEVVSELELTAFQNGYYLALGLTVGGCKLCPECAPPGESCRHPFKARPSPEGFGVDITELAREAGIPVEWPPKKYVSFIGMVLV